MMQLPEEILLALKSLCVLKSLTKWFNTERQKVKEVMYCSSEVKSLCPSNAILYHVVSIDRDIVSDHTKLLLSFKVEL